MSVLERKNNKCISCGSKENLNVYHIRPFAKFPKLRFDINNGRTLCLECHKKTPTYSKKRKTVLITGVAGYLGDALAKTLLNTNSYVYGIDNLMYTNYYPREHELFDFYGIDIRNYTEVDKIIQKINPDCIIHLAGIVGDGACAVNPEMTIEVNEDATKFISECCIKYNIRLIFASSCSVYGMNNELLTEESDTNPLSLYASGKLRAEEFVKKVPEHFIFRLGTLYGLSTEHARLRFDLVANILTAKAVYGEELNVFGGEQFRPILHVMDVISILARCAIKKYKEDDFGTYILSDRNFKISDIADSISSVIQKMTDKKVKIITTDMKFEDLRNYKVNPKKSYRAGFKPRIQFEFGIAELASFILEGRIANIWDVCYHNARYVKERFGG